MTILSQYNQKSDYIIQLVAESDEDSSYYDEISINLVHSLPYDEVKLKNRSSGTCAPALHISTIDENDKSSFKIHVDYDRRYKQNNISSTMESVYFLTLDDIMTLTNSKVRFECVIPKSVGVSETIGHIFGYSKSENKSDLSVENIELGVSPDRSDRARKTLFTNKHAKILQNILGNLPEDLKDKLKEVIAASIKSE